MSASADLQVVPERTQADRAGAYRVFVWAMLVGLVAALVGAGMRDGVPPLGLLAMFATLVIVAENRDRIFGDETSISGSIAIAAASIVAFQGSTPLFGPLACAACAGLYWEHIRDRTFDKVVINAASIGFSALAGAGVLEILTVDRTNSAIDIVVQMIPVVAIYWLVNTCVLAVALRLLRGDELVASVRNLLRSEVSMLGFALLGGLCGWLFLTDGYVASGLSAALLLVLLDLLVIVPRHISLRWITPALAARLRVRISPLLGAALLPFFTADQLPTTLSVIAAIVVGLAVSFVVAFVRVHRRIGIWDRHLALGVATADAPLVVVFAIGGALAAWAGIWVALGFVCVAVAFGLVAVRWRRRRLGEAAAEDERLASAVELALLDSRDRSSSR